MFHLGQHDAGRFGCEHALFVERRVHVVLELPAQHVNQGPDPALCGMGAEKGLWNRGVVELCGSRVGLEALGKFTAVATHTIEVGADTGRAAFLRHDPTPIGEGRTVSNMLRMPTHQVRNPV